jgi:hypothetical protein
MSNDVTLIASVSLWLVASVTVRLAVPQQATASNGA